MSTSTSRSGSGSTRRDAFDFGSFSTAVPPASTRLFTTRIVLAARSTSAHLSPATSPFGGVFEVVGRRNVPKALSYDIKLRQDLMGPYIRRLVVRFAPPGRAVRLNMETYIDLMEVVAVLEQPYSGEKFPGHDRINHTFDVLAAAVTQDRQDWRGALQYLKGVYIIHDQKTGKSYVGSACGGDGIWSRLCQYVASLDGGNKGLRELVDQKGPDYMKQNLRFALLEIMPMKTADDAVLTRENYWKDVLLSRQFGLNRN